ncbi:MAG: TauD/TfdA dioxygenase family protein [Alphaproteobacteria bacterium]
MPPKSDLFDLSPLPGATFGGVMTFKGGMGARAATEALEKNPRPLLDAIYASGGFLLIPGMDEILEEPKLMVRLSQLFGREVEDNLKTYTAENKTLFNIHEEVPEIILVTNAPPINSQPMTRPEPPLTADGKFPTRFPHRKGWHTDQSFRRPPPDFSLFIAVQPTPKGQGQTLFADGTAAYASLPAHLKKRIEGLEGLHALPGNGRSEKAVREGQAPKPLLPHQRSQKHPLVRVHPVTGKPALYMCESGQMDWIDGPIVGMEPGPDGEGGKLIYELMRHITQDEYVYVHDWTKGELVIYDNRNLLHAPSWYEADKYIRIMWRTTVMGNPGPEYAGERPSWIPRTEAAE